jgi:hypothetical protein
VRGLNSRKGVCRSREDLLDEIADVIITAAVAMSAAADDSAHEAAIHLERRLDVVTARIGVQTSPAWKVCEAAGVGCASRSIGGGAQR